jgi:hypothetical protein
MLKRESVPLIPSEPSQCQTQEFLRLLNEPGAMEQHISSGSIRDDLDSLGAYIGAGGNSQLETDLQEGGAEAELRIAEATSKMGMLEANLSSLFECLQSTILNKQAKMSQLYDLQTQLADKEKEAKDKEAIAATALERAETVRDPYANTNRWESWFPLHRPMKQTSVPVLLAISVFLLVVSIGLFLQLASIELQFSFIPSREGFLVSNIGTNYS